MELQSEREQKWETYKNLYNAFSLPSFHLLLLCMALITFFNWKFTKSTAEIIAGASTLFLFLLSAGVNLFVNRRLYQSRIMLYLLSSLCIALSLYYSLVSSFTVNTDINGTILSVDTYRYSSRIVFAHNKKKACSFLPYTVEAAKGDIFRGADAKKLETDSAFSKSLLREGISSSAFYSDKCRIQPSGRKSFKSAMRNALLKQIDLCFDNSTGSLLKALFVGSKHYLDKQTIYNFKKSGLLHLLAASGMHVGIIAGILYLILGAFPITQKLKLVICSLVLIVYLYITDIPVSLLRACIMFWLLTLFTVTNRYKNAFNILFLSGIIILVLHPSELYGLGFQLSFLATFGILLCYKTFVAILPKIPLKISESIALSLSAQMFVIPVIFLTLGEFNTAGIAATIPAVPLLTLIIYTSFVSMGLSAFLPRLGVWTGYLPSALNQLLSIITRFFAESNLHTADTRLYMIIIPLMIFIFSAFINRLNKIKAPLLLACGIFLSSAILLSRPDNDFQIYRSHQNPHFYMIQHGNCMTICGSIHKDDSETIVRKITESGIHNIQLIVTYNKEAYSFKPVVTALPVKRCIFLNEYSKYHKDKLERLLERDNIPYKTVTYDDLEETNRELGYEFLKIYKKKIIFDKYQFKKENNSIYF